MTQQSAADRRRILETAIKEALGKVRAPEPKSEREMPLQAKISAFESLRRWAAWGRS